MGIDKDLKEQWGAKISSEKRDKVLRSLSDIASEEAPPYLKEQLKRGHRASTPNTQPFFRAARWAVPALALVLLIVTQPWKSPEPTQVVENVSQEEIELYAFLTEDLSDFGSLGSDFEETYDLEEIL